MATLKSANGRWVVGRDFFNRTREIGLLRERVEAGNHVLLTGQRRMGKTSVAKELGRQLSEDGWVFLFADVEDAESPEDLVAEIAEAGHPVRGMLTRFAERMKNYFTENIEEISANDFKLKIRAGLDAGSWKNRGEELFASCARHPQRVLLVIDELPIFLSRLLNQGDGDDNARDIGKRQVENFLSWFRRQLQQHSDGSLVILVSGSIGLEPLVRRLGLSDRINHLEPTFRVGPWDEGTAKDCLSALSNHYCITLEDGVPERVCELLGVGIPHHVQAFFTRLREDAVMHARNRVTVADVDRLYQNGMLGPSGQNDLAHYEKRLREGLDGQTHEVAMEILTEAALQEVFDGGSRRCLADLYRPLIPNVEERITEALEVLQHDGYLKASDDGYSFESRLLRDWWRARYKGHYEPLCRRLAANGADRSNRS